MAGVLEEPSREISIEALRRAALARRVAALKAGFEAPGRRRIRPRDPEKVAMLHRMCRDVRERHPPVGWVDSTGERHLLLPWLERGQGLGET